MSGRRGNARWLGGGLTLFGGLLVLASGVVTQGLLLSALSVVEGQVPHYVGGIAGFTAAVAVALVVLLISLGGVTIMAGGISILFGHRTIGRLLVALGGGAGFLGLAISFGVMAYRLGVESAIGNTPYWLGLVIAVIGRQIAKRA
jgi:hypothetical protein